VYHGDVIAVFSVHPFHDAGKKEGESGKPKKLDLVKVYMAGKMTKCVASWDQSLKLRDYLLGWGCPIGDRRPTGGPRKHQSSMGEGRGKGGKKGAQAQWGVSSVAEGVVGMVMHVPRISKRRGVVGRMSTRNGGNLWEGSGIKRVF